jgi:methyl-accepting chemotaxis protein
LIDSIAQANGEQSSALEEVTIAVRQMDEMTQHNAALVEQTNAAIEQTEAQAAELDSVVDVFKLDGATKQSRPSMKARAALHAVRA